MKNKLGYIISGSLTEGFVMRITNAAHLEEIKAGKFVCIAGDHHTFFSLITDLSLAVTHPDILLFPPSEKEKLLAKILAKKDIYATASVKPMLMMTKEQRVIPVKTIPPHFAPIFEADKKDIALIFGDENDTKTPYFNIGCPLDMDTPVCINLERLTERSNGIFGKTGTGKTFLTRLVLAGLVKQDQAVNLIFDMHSEYGLQARKEGSHSFVKGLKTLFPSKVALFSLDPQSTRRRGATPDVEINLPYSAVHVEDILALQEELNLHSTAVEAAHLIAARHKHEWLGVLLAQGDRLKEFAAEIGGHPESIAALYRKLKRIERFPFFRHAAGGNFREGSSIDQLIEYLSKGISVIIEFGNFTSSLCYLLLANMITRRIHTEYIEKTEKFLASQRAEDEPKKLMITIEEAHKFLNPHAARQTIFGTIAREMRKYYVSLLVVDQRPSGIDPEIISQIGTKIIAQLNDDKDIQAVLTGISNAHHLRGILASLDTKKQAMIVGHAVAMPVVVQTREYDEVFYRAMAPQVSAKQIDVMIQELF
ncbi:ATP-binding protein [Candidatus Dependentiae bacterium]|nr:ATP-binding protein [Candidatus Dependentiae bacterium]